MPTCRYYHAAVMLDFPPETGTLMGDQATFRMIMFGGDDGSQVCLTSCVEECREIFL